MTEAQARADIEIMTEAATYPELSREEVDYLVRQARRADKYGLAPSEATWTPTYDLNAAAARGWELKAGKAARKFDASDADSSMKRSQIAAACREQATIYRRRIASSVRCGVSDVEIYEAIEDA